MAATFFVSITGKQQGPFRGTRREGDNHRHWIRVLRADITAERPRDASTGTATGRRHHDPVRLRVDYCPAISQFYDALSKNEPIEEAIVQVWDTARDGEECPRGRFVMKNGHVNKVEITFDQQDYRHGQSSATNYEINMTFDQIEFHPIVAKKTFADDWQNT